MVCKPFTPNIPHFLHLHQWAWPPVTFVVKRVWEKRVKSGDFFRFQLASPWSCPTLVSYLKIQMTTPKFLGADLVPAAKLRSERVEINFRDVQRRLGVSRVHILTTQRSHKCTNDCNNFKRLTNPHLAKKRRLESCGDWTGKYKCFWCSRKRCGILCCACAVLKGRFLLH